MKTGLLCCRRRSRNSACKSAISLLFHLASYASLSEFVEQAQSVNKGVDVAMVESDEEVRPPVRKAVNIPEEPSRAGPSREEKGKDKEEQRPVAPTLIPGVELAKERLRARRQAVGQTR